MKAPIDKGCSILNAADETANPYGLILSEVERNHIYGKLNSIGRVLYALCCSKGPHRCCRGGG
jgi:hypothetical protein